MIFRIDEGNYVGGRTLLLEGNETLSCYGCRKTLDVYEGVYYCQGKKNTYCLSCIRIDRRHNISAYVGIGNEHHDIKVDKIEGVKKEDD